MSAETLATALVVLGGATVVSMIKEFISKPWHLEEGVVYIEGRAYQSVQPVLQTQHLPVPAYQAQPRVVPAYQPARLEAPIPEPALALAAESRA